MSEDKSTATGIQWEKPSYGIGLLGATGAFFMEMEANRLLVIEQRILGIEALLRAAGIPIIAAADPEAPA